MTTHPTPTRTLAVQLEAWFAEDEAVALAATPGPWRVRHGFPAYVSGHSFGVAINAVTADMEATDASHIARHDPARVLAQVASGRAILALHWSYVDPNTDGPLVETCDCGQPTPCPTLAALALPYADRPEYEGLGL